MVQWHFVTVDFLFDKSLEIYNTYVANMQNIFDKNLLGYGQLMADL